MNKEELLQELSSKINAGEISRDEVFKSINVSAPMGTDVKITETKKSSHFSVTKMLYVLGAAIVVIGIFIFVAQIWDEINSFSRILITLGMGVLTAVTGSVLFMQKKEQNLGAIFHCIGGVLIPGGIAITLYELNVTGHWLFAAIYAIVFACYLSLVSLHKHAILTLFAIVNGTITAYLTLNALMGGPVRDWEFLTDSYQYLTMAIGLGYLYLAYAFREGWNQPIKSILCLFGITGFLFSAFFKVFDSILWQLLYFIIVIGGLYLSVYLKSRSVLVMSTVFLIAHISYITGKYFADSVGWPISLVFLGFVLIGLGYASVTINKKYIKEGN